MMWAVPQCDLTDNYIRKKSFESPQKDELDRAANVCIHRVHGSGKAEAEI